MAAYFYFCALVAVAAACTPGGGSTTPSRSPTFSFKFSPPIRWTWNTPATALRNGQQSTVARAEKRMNDDIELAIYRALNRYNIPTSSAKFDVNVDTPQLLLHAVVADAGKCGTTVPTTIDYGYDENTVTHKCDIVAPGSVYTLPGTIRVSTPIDYMEYQWLALVEEVQSNLEDVGCQFDGEIKIRL